MAQHAASYGEAVLHKPPFQTWHGVAKRRRLKHCFRLHFITPRQAAKASQHEASPFHSDMKHFAYAPYDVIKWKMRVYPFAIQRYPHYIMTSNPVLYGWIFLCLDFTHRISSIYSNTIAPTENKQRTVKSPFSGVFFIIPRQILCLVRSLVLSKRLSCNCIESNILQKHTAK